MMSVVSFIVMVAMPVMLPVAVAVLLILTEGKCSTSR